MNTGTIPSKTLREAVLYLSGVHQRGFYGVSYRVKPQITMQDLMFRCHQVIQREVDVYRAQFGRNGVDVLEGHAAFEDPHTIRVTGGTGEGLFRAERFVIATGTTPVLPRGVPTDHAAVIDSDGLFRLTNIPRSMIVVGGGVIGVEYACMFSTLGVAVTLVDGRRRILEFLDAEIVEALVYHMRTNGVTFRLGEVVERVECVEGRHVVAHLASQKQLQAETLLCAAGRQGNTDTLNLGAAGLDGRRPRPARGGRRVPHRGAPHLRGGRRDRLPEPGLGLDGAGPGGQRHAFGIPTRDRRPRCSRTGSTRSPRCRSSGSPRSSSRRTGCPTRSASPTTARSPAARSSATPPAC